MSHAASEITPVAAIELAEARCLMIAHYGGTLRAILERHEDVIRKRWTNKRSRPKRKELLLKAWPAMPATHRPDLAAFRREMRDGNTPCHTAHREAYMWPHINLEDLSDGVTMLRFLHARGRHDPNVFADQDLESLRAGLRSGGLPAAKQLAGYIMELRSALMEGYGSIRRKKPDESDDIQIKARVFTASDGLYVLEVQERFLAFLVSCTNLILHDKDLGDMELPVFPDPGPLPVQQENEHLDAVRLTEQATYSAPRNVDLVYIDSLIATRLASSMDHLYVLREDPGYFADTVQNWAEHSSEAILDEKRRPHREVTDPIRRGWFWDRTVANVIFEAHEEICLWSCMATFFPRVMKAEEEYARSGEQTNNFIYHVRMYRHYLDEVMIPRYLPHKLHGIISASPPIRPLFKLVPDNTAWTSMAPIPAGVRPRAELDRKNDDLIFIWTLFNEKDYETFGLETLSSELQRLLQSKTYKSRITPSVAEVIADVGLVGEIRNQLRIRLPDVFDEEDCPYYEGLRLQTDEFTSPLRELRRLTRHKGDPDPAMFIRLGEYGDPALGKLHYPVNKRQSEENTKALQAAEANLDEMWATFDAHIKLHMDGKAHTVLRSVADSCLPREGGFQRTPDWVKPQPPAPEAQIAKSSTKNDNDVPASFAHGAGSNQRISPIVPKLKIKTKTRKDPTDDAALQLDQLALEDETAPQSDTPTFLVQRRACKVFAALFHSPSSSVQPAGEVPWLDFVHAMVAIGFAPEKLYGSVWRFSPQRGGGVLGVDRAINFHEPHPHSKLSLRTVRRFGRRLTRNYGLEGSMFALDEGDVVAAP